MEKRKLLALVLMAGLIVALTFPSAFAEEFTVLGNPLKLFGYADQEASIGLRRAYDTEQGLNSALMNIFAEGDYQITKDLKFYGSGMLTVDWIYQLDAHRASWENKLFSKSQADLNVDDKYWQLLKEARFTWSPGDFMFRVGKQIVSWGELLAFRIMDQINPLDQRRGFLDVDFETTIIPIWLLRADYYPKLKLSWLQDLGFEFVYNPNADFIPSQPLVPGNANAGIWAPNVPIPGAHLATLYGKIDNPDRWKQGDVAFRAKADMFGAVTTLNFFYGRQNLPNLEAVPPFLAPVPPHIFASDGNLLLHPFDYGQYTPFRFVGATVAKEIVPLKASFLGNVAPTVYFECLYAFKDTFTWVSPLNPFANRFGTSDDLRTGIEVAWKAKIPALNEISYFAFTGEFFYRRVMNPPSMNVNGETILDVWNSPLRQNNCQSFLSVNTSYFHNKLTPTVSWIHDFNTNSNYFIPSLVYDMDIHWHFTLGAQIFNGAKSGEGFQVFDNKDQIYFKIAYKWG